MRPKLATLVYCVRDGRVLLLRRAKEPCRGMWTAPGGKVEPGESPAACAARELYEETGLRARRSELKGIIFETSPRQDWQWLIFIYMVTEFDFPEEMLSGGGPSGCVGDVFPGGHAQSSPAACTVGGGVDGDGCKAGENGRCAEFSDAVCGCAGNRAGDVTTREGVLRWWSVDAPPAEDFPEADRVFFPRVMNGSGVFELTFRYDGDIRLVDWQEDGEATTGE